MTDHPLFKQCDPNCYIKGKGCALSLDGRCLILFARKGGPVYTLDKPLKDLDKFIKDHNIDSTLRRSIKRK